MMAACSEDVTQIINGGKKEFTATIAAPNSGGTRTAYNESGGDINVAWTEGDEIALVHNGVKDVVTVTAVDNTTGKATISGYITNATNGAAVALVYPAALVSEATGDGANYTEDNTVKGLMLTQSGNRDYIQENIDFREDNTPTLSVDGTGVTLSSDANLSSKIAILKLTLQDDAVSPATLNATQVKINKGTDILASTATIAATSEVYLAVPSVTTSSTLTIEATVDGSPYTYTKDVIKVDPQTYYQSTVNLSKTIVLSTVTDATTIKDGYTVTGTLDVANHPVQISIAAGATVTLDGVTINGVNNSSYKWAGITSLGDANIILKDGSTNTVKGFFDEYPGILAAVGHTLIIKGGTEGTGKLIASSNGYGAGIGGGNQIACGNIEIQGGTIEATGGSGDAGIGSGYKAGCGSITISGGAVTATGGLNAAGIGSGYSGDSNGSATCGNITISGGTVSATGGQYGAGIGSGKFSSCGAITITTGVTSVTATKDASAPNSIGKGAGSGATCGTVTIGGKEYWDGSAYQNGGDTKLPTSPYTYPAPSTAINGKFTINNTGKQVYFAKGNLQATYNGSEWSWGFATNQWDYIGGADYNNSTTEWTGTKTGNNFINGNGTMSENGTVDLFNWVGASAPSYYFSTAPAYYGISNIYSPMSAYGNTPNENLMHDWGECIGAGWRTLTMNEWIWILGPLSSPNPGTNCRLGSTVNSTENARFSPATVNTDGTGMKGLILFPDGLTIANIEGVTWGPINNIPYDGTNCTNCTTAGWAALAAKGCVFLPVTSFRFNQEENSVDIPINLGFYWSATGKGENTAYSILFSRRDNSFSSTMEYTDRNRTYGCAVRLVYDIE